MNQALTKGNTPSAPGDSGTGHLVLWMTVTAIQLTLVSWTFPLGELFSERPLLYIDHPIHLHRIMLAAELGRDGLTTGYDPFFGAGSPAGMAWNPAAKLPAMLAIIGADPVVAWKLYTFLAAVLAPGLLVAAGALLRLPLHLTRWAALLGTLLWWASMFRWFHTAGMVSFVFASYIAVTYLAGLSRFAEKEGRAFRQTLMLGTSGGIAALIHPLFPFIVLPGGLSLLWINRKRFTITSLTLLCLAVPALVVGINWFWLRPTFFDPPYIGTSYGIHQARVDVSMLWVEAIGLWKGNYHGSRVYPLILGALLVAGWARWRGDRLPPLLTAFTVGGVALIVYAAFGAAIPGAAGLTQPNRFAVSGYLLLAFPAAHGLSLGIRNRWHLMPRWPARIVTLLLLALVAVNLNEVRREISSRPIGHYGKVPPEVEEMGPKSRFILDWLATSTTPQARVLFETSHARIHDRGHMAGLLAYRSGREFIGGPYVFQHYAGFWDHTLFGRDIREHTSESLLDHFRRYNIGWIVAHHPITITHLDTLPGVRKVAEFEGLAFYHTDAGGGYFLQGSGRVRERSINRLVLDELRGSSILISYHYMQGLRCTPSCVVRAVRVGEDPTPFIQLVDPPESVVLTWRGE